MLDGRMVEALFEIIERGFYILSVAFAASAPKEGRPSTFIASTNDAFVVARVDQIDLDAKSENNTDLSSALSQLRTSQEGSEFWSVVTRTAEVEKR